MTANGETSFGQQVRQHREALGLTRKELARRISCSVETIRKIESGERYPSVQIAELLAKHLEFAADGQLLRHLRQAKSPLLVTPEFPLIGRETEWQTLRAAWRTAIQGAAHLVCIAGDAGIGKTRLAEELLADAQRHGYPMARTRAYALEGRLAYAPVADWLRSNALNDPLSKLDPVWRSEIARLLPELLIDDATLPPPQPMTERWQQKRLFEALLHGFSLLEVPLLLVLDDLQWCDVETLEWLQYVLGAGARLKLLVVATMRDAEVDAVHPARKLLRHVLQEGQLTDIVLPALNQQQTANLGKAVARDRLDAQVVDHLFHECAGNPLFVIESIRFQHAQHAQHAQQIEQAEPQTAIASKDFQHGPPLLPPKIHALIQARLTQLSPTARALADLAAVIGRAFTPELLMHAAQCDEDSVAQGLDELWRRRMTHEVDDGHYDFSHDRIRDVAYAEIGPVQRHRLHRQIAQALEAVHGAERDAISGELAVHYARANLVSNAVHYHQRAAAVARRRFANEDAVDHLSQAVRLLQTLPETPERQQQELSLQIELSAALLAARSMTAVEVEAAYRRAEDLARLVGEPPELFPARFGWWVFQFSMAEQRAALEIGQELLASAHRLGNPDFVLQAHHALWTSSFASGDFQAALAHCEHGEAIYQPETHHAQLYRYGAHDTGVCCLSYGSLARWCLGYPDQALETCKQTLELSRHLTHPASLAQAAYLSAVLHQLRCDIDEVRHQAEAARRISSKHVVPFWMGWDTCLLGWADFMQGQQAAGIQQMLQGLDFMQVRRARLLHSYFTMLLADMYDQSGQRDRAIQTLDAAMAAAEQTGERWWVAEMHRLHGDLLQHSSEDAAEQSYLQAIDIARSQCAKSLELRATVALCRLWQSQDRTAEAHQLLSDLCGWFTEGFDTPDLLAAQALLVDLSKPGF